MTSSSYLRYHAELATGQQCGLTSVCIPRAIQYQDPAPGRLMLDNSIGMVSWHMLPTPGFCCQLVLAVANPWHWLHASVHNVKRSGLPGHYHM